MRGSCHRYWCRSFSFCWLGLRPFYSDKSVQWPYVKSAMRALEPTSAIRESEMANTAIIRDAYGVPAIFVGSKTGRDDAPFVFVRVGGEERRMRWSEWDSLPAWTGETPSWASKSK